MKKLLFMMAVGSASMFAANACSGAAGAVTNANQTLTIYSQLGSGGDMNNIVVSNGTTLNPDLIGNCIINGITFSNFQVDAVGPFLPSTPFQFSVTIDGNGLDFLYTNLGAADIEIEYKINPGITLMTLSDGSSTSVSENVCSNQAALPGETCNTLIVGGSNMTTNIANPNATASINAAAFDWVVKDVTGGSDMAQAVSAVPEPITFSLMGAGLLGLGLLRRKLKK